MDETLLPVATLPASPFSTLTRVHSLALFLALVLVFTAFFPSLSNGFVNLDDPGYVLENPLIRDLSVKSVKTIFSTIYQAHYMPLVLLSFAVENHYFGLDPFVFHLNNVILHTANFFLVFLFIFLFLSPKSVSDTQSPRVNFWIALCTALVFGIHPLRVESVAWITERKDVLYAFFFLTSLCAYLYSQDPALKGFYTHDAGGGLPKKPCPGPQSGARWGLPSGFGGYLTSLFFFLLALFAKGSAVTLPVVLLLIEGFRGQLPSLRNFARIVPFLFFACVFGVIAMRGVAELAQTSHSPLFRFLIATHGAGFYVVKTLLPLELSPHYPYPADAVSDLPWVFFLSPFFCLFLAVAGWWAGRKIPLIAFGCLFYVFTIAPFLQWIPAGPVIVAIWFSYIPSIGLSLIFAIMICEMIRWLKRRSNSGLMVFSLFLGAMLPVVTVQTQGRCVVWSDSVTLWNDVIKRHPCFFAYINRGQGFHERGDLPEALRDFKKAQEMLPTSELALLGLGRVWRDLGNASQALVLFEEARRHNPSSKDAANNLGLLWLSQGKMEKAISYFDEAIHLDREFAKAWNNRGTAFRESGKLEESLADIDKAIELYPNAGPMLLNRALTLSRLGKKEAARGDLRKARTLGINPPADIIRQIDP